MIMSYSKVIIDATPVVSKRSHKEAAKKLANTKSKLESLIRACSNKSKA